jgi:hypothetical protein
MGMIRFNTLPGLPGLWRASLDNAPHIGGTGHTPEAAAGWMILNNPQQFGVNHIQWDQPTPGDLDGVPRYPSGLQEVADLAEEIKT